MPIEVDIVGAGLGGLTLARVLHVHGIKARVYEAETSSNARHQGGMLDIHAHNGQAAIRDAHLYAGFLELVHLGGQSVRVASKDGAILFDRPDDGTGGRPEVRRGELRQMLLTSLPPGTVRWAHKLRNVTKGDRGRHGLHFTNGTFIETALLVGADGAWSKVRPLVSSALPQYTGITYIDLYASDCDDRLPHSSSLVGSGALYALAPGKGIHIHREPGNVLHAYVELEKPISWVESIDFSDAEAAKAQIAAEFNDWSPALTALIRNSDTAPVPRPIYALPDGHRWPRTPGVTLLGDAAHLTLPSGEGANLALYDGAALGKALAADHSDVTSALASYETALFEESREAAADAYALRDVVFGSEAPNSLVRMLTSATSFS